MNGMESTFTQTTFGSSGIKVSRLGLSATHRPGKKVLHVIRAKPSAVQSAVHSLTS